MENVTLLVGLAAAAIVLVVPLRWCFLVYLVSLLYYPPYLRLMIFGCTISVGRLVIAVLLIRCLMDTRLLRNFHWIKLDTLIVVADVIYTAALLLAAGDVAAVLKQRAGIMLETTVTYFAARLIINDRASLVHFVKSVVIVLLGVAFLGIIEAGTTISPYNGLMGHRFNADNALGGTKFDSQEVIMGHGHEGRWGFFRAQGAQSHPIIFGASFVVFLPLIWKLFCSSERKQWHIPVFGIIALGGASSLSSTPFTGLIVAISGLAFERFKRWTKVVLLSGALFCVFIEFYSAKHHFYYVLLAKISSMGGAGYDRGRLMDAAFRHLPEYWLTGYGFNDPGWGPEVFRTDYTDVCINYIYIAVTYGIFGLFAYVAILCNLLGSLWRRYRMLFEGVDRDICWALIISVVTIIIIDFGVAPFGALPSLYSIIFGIGGAFLSPSFNRRGAVARSQLSMSANGLWRPKTWRIEEMP